MRILFIADPNSIHDFKWMEYFMNSNQCFIAIRKIHYSAQSLSKIQELEKQYNITYVGTVSDFSLRRIFGTILSAVRLSNILNKFKIDIVHIYFADPNALWALVKYVSKSNTRWYLTTRGSDVLLGLKGHFESSGIRNMVVRHLYNKALRMFNHIMATSSEQVHLLRKFNSNLPIKIIRTGVDVDKVLQDTKIHLPQSLENVKYLLFPRSMRPVYNHELCLEAIKLLPNHIKSDYQFVFIDVNSTDVDYVNKIRTLMNSDIKSRFLFLQTQNQETIWEMYKCASIIIMTPLSDGTPVSAMEAMCCKTPLILGNLQYDADIFRSCIPKLKSWNPSELTELILSILENRHQYDLEDASTHIIRFGNRYTEMNRLKALYEC